MERRKIFGIWRMGLRGKSNYCGGFYVCTLMIIGKSNSNQNISCNSSSAWLKVHFLFGTKMESVRPKTPSKIVWINPGTLWCAIPDLVICNSKCCDMQFQMSYVQLWMLRKLYAWLLWWKFKSLCFKQFLIKEMPRICSGNGINHEGEQQNHPHQSSTSTETTSKSTKARSAKTTPRTSTKAVSRIFSIWKFSAFSGILWQMVQGKMRN